MSSFFTERDYRVSPTKRTSEEPSLRSEPASNTQEAPEPTTAMDTCFEIRVMLIKFPYQPVPVKSLRSLSAR